MKCCARCRMRWGAIAVALSVWVPTSQAAPASGEVCEFDVPASRLETSLLEIARRCNVMVSLSPELLEGRMAPAVRGRLTVRQAFELAIQPSGLAVGVAPSGTFTIVAPAAVATESAAPSVSPAPSPTPTASPAVAPMAKLPPVVVTGSPAGSGLRALRSWSATRTHTPLAELPQAVSVLTDDTLALQGGRSITDAAAFVPGLTVATVVSGSAEDFAATGLSVPSLMVRGMPAAYVLSGLRMLRESPAPDNFFLDRVEVVKGPSGVIDGVADWKGRGGVVNMMLKAPQDTPRTVLTQTISSRDSGTVRLTADVSRPVNENASWRLLGYGEKSGRTDGGYDANAGGGWLGAGSLRLGSFTGTLTVHMERRHDAPSAAAVGGRTRVGNVIANLPAERVVRTPDDPSDRLMSTASDVHLALSWALSPDWTLTGKTMLELLRNDMRRHQPFTQAQLRQVQAENLITQWGLVGELTHEEVRHRVLLGVDANRWRAKTLGVDFVDGNSLQDIEIRESKVAVLLQDEVSLGELRLRAAVQRARVPTHEDMRRVHGTGEFVILRDFLPTSGTNWDAGVLYQLTPSVAVYAGTQRTNEASLVLPDQQVAGEPLAPTITRQSQAGLKLNAIDRRWTGSLEVFRIHQSDFKILNFLDRLVPGRLTSGLDVELTGRPIPRLEFALGFSYLRAIDPFILNGATVDRQANQVARRSMYLLSRVRLGDVIGQDDRLGLTFHAASSTQVGFPYHTPEPLTLPGGGNLDLTWETRFGAWTLNGALRNVFDQRLFGPAAELRFIPLQPGRSVTLSASYEH